MDHLRPTLEGDVLATARAVEVGRRVGVADIERRDGRGSVAPSAARRARRAVESR